MGNLSPLVRISAAGAAGLHFAPGLLTVAIPADCGHVAARGQRVAGGGDLTLEDIEEPVTALNKLVTRFDDFRWHRRKARKPNVSEEVARVPAEAAQAIAAIQQDLVTHLPAILDDILPIGRRRRWLTRPSRRFGRGDRV